MVATAERRKVNVDYVDELFSTHYMKGRRGAIYQSIMWGKQYNFRQKMFDTFIGNCSTSEQRKCSTTKISTENVRQLL